MNDEERSERADRLSKRLGDESSNKQDRDDRDDRVKDRSTLLMYLPDELIEEVGLRFEEINLKYRKETGRSLEKNKDFYPALVRAGLEGKDIKDVLDL